MRAPCPVLLVHRMADQQLRLKLQDPVGLALEHPIKKLVTKAHGDWPRQLGVAVGDPIVGGERWIDELGAGSASFMGPTS